MDQNFRLPSLFSRHNEWLTCSRVYSVAAFEGIDLLEHLSYNLTSTFNLIDYLVDLLLLRMLVQQRLMVFFCYAFIFIFSLLLQASPVLRVLLLPLRL